MFDLIIVPHRDISGMLIKSVIEIKSKAWPYSFDRQLDWIESNIKAGDIHVILTLNKINVAYLNLIEIDLKIDETGMPGYGIGNVCTSEKGKGWGKEIMTQTNSYLAQKNKTGILFCKNSLVDFYARNNWYLIEKKKLALSFNNESIEAMIYNYNKNFNTLEYIGKPF
jgi:predicted GNAT family N-acyltransferase